MNAPTNPVNEPVTNTPSVTTITNHLENAELKQIVSTLFNLLMERKNPVPFDRGAFCSLLKKIDVDKLYLEEKDAKGKRRFANFETFIEWLAEEARKLLRDYANGSNRILKNGYKLIQAYVIYNRLADKITDENLPTQITVLLAFIHCPVADQVVVCKKVLASANGKRITKEHVLDGMKAHGIKGVPEYMPSGSTRFAEVKAFLPTMEPLVAKHPELKSEWEKLKQIVRGELRVRDACGSSKSNAEATGVNAPEPSATGAPAPQQRQEGTPFTPENEETQAAEQLEPTPVANESRPAEGQTTPSEIQPDIERTNDIEIQSGKQGMLQPDTTTPPTQMLPQQKHQENQTPDVTPASEQGERPKIDFSSDEGQMMFTPRNDRGYEVLRKAGLVPRGFSYKKKPWRRVFKKVRPGDLEKEYIDMVTSAGGDVIKSSAPVGSPMELDLFD